MKKVLLTTAMSLMMCIGIYAQEYEWKKPPKPTETEIGLVTYDCNGGWVYCSAKDEHYFDDHRENISDEKLYESLLDKARGKYAGKYPKLTLRNFKSTYTDKNNPRYDDAFKAYRYIRMYYSSATVVIKDAEIETNENLSKVFDKALRNVSEGSRLAIDQITVTSSMDKENLKDQLIDVLLEKGYRVVAKEYLQKLYKEQEDQLKSGIYNPETTVEGSKFSAVGYFINVKVTETSIRVQVVNVSTGEYEGNATVNF